MQDILLDFTQVPSLGNEHRVVNILFNKTVYVTPWCRSVSSVKKTPELNPTRMRTNNDRMVLRSTCPMFRTNKSRFMSRKEIIVSHISLIGPVLKEIFGSGAGNSASTDHDGFR